MARKRKDRAPITPFYRGWLKKGRRKREASVPRWRKSIIKRPQLPTPFDSTLLGLPGEIRNQIYDLLFRTNRHGTLGENDNLPMALLRTCKRIYNEVQPVLWNLRHVRWDAPIIHPRAPGDVMYQNEGPKKLVIQLRFMSPPIATNLFDPTLFHRGEPGPQMLPANPHQLHFIGRGLNSGENIHGFGHQSLHTKRGHHGSTAPQQTFSVKWMKRNWDWIFDEKKDTSRWPPTLGKPTRRRDARGMFLPGSVASTDNVGGLFATSTYQNIDELVFRLVGYEKWTKRFEGRRGNYNDFLNQRIPVHTKDLAMLLAWMPKGDRPTIKVVGEGAYNFEEDVRYCALARQFPNQPMPPSNGSTLLLVEALDNEMRSWGAPEDWTDQILGKNIEFVG